jgi:DNA repair exonuclease SbcCD ATPase subunit
LIKPKVVKVPFRKLKYIHHISDIQIRNLKRHKEYEEVFERTYEEVRKHKDNAVAYIGGDIAHSKTDMSPELVDELSRLFKNLADICPTIIIAGNHDCNLNNRSRMDVLSPIVNNLQHPNLHYLKDTGVYKFADTNFVVWDCWTDEKDFIEAKDVEGDTKVVLFHGTVDRCETDLGYRLPSDVKITKFEGYDLGLLGDIHKRQHLNKEETISYCGSLVQQNHGEGLSHGYLLWDVPKRKSEYIEIPNDYGYYTLDIDNGILPDVNDMPKKARLRVRVSNTSATELKKALAVIHDKYGIEEMSVTRTDSLYSSDRVRNKSISVGDINNTDVQYQLIVDYLNANHIVDEATLIKIKNINESLNQDLPEEEVYRNVNWTLKKLEFSNMFSYGENNVVNFTKLNGIVGMFAPNAQGKSSLLDALSFCLFDTCSRAFKAENVLNNKKGDFTCKVNFEIDGQDYYIERVAKKQRKGNVKVDVEFYTIGDDGDKVSMNGDQRRTTDVNIRKVIGSYDDFILTALSSQIKNSVFIEKTQKEKKTLLAQFMGLEIFDKLWTSASEEIKDVSAVLKNFKNNNWERELSDIKEGSEKLEVDQLKLNQEMDELQSSKQLVESNILSLTKKLRTTDKSIEDIDNLKDNKNNLSNTLSNIDNELGEVVMRLEKALLLDTELNTKIQNHKDEKTEEKFVELESLENSKREFEIDLDKKKIQIRVKLDKIEKLGDLEWDDDCDYCMSNPFTLDARETKKKLEDDKTALKNCLEEFDSIVATIDSLYHTRERKADLEDSISKIQQVSTLKNELESKKVLLNEKKKNVLHQINSIEEKIIKYYDQEKDIVYNQQIESEIDNLQNTNTDLSYQIDTLNKKLITLHGQLQVLSTNSQTILSNIKKVEELESKYHAYQYYLDAIKRDGIPYELITKALPTIEGEVNNILSQLVDFQILFEMDGKNINNYIVYDADNTWPLELSSGMERFISSLAIRVGLINVSNLPRSNFLAIDEGWGTMDSDNLNSVYSLFQYLKSQFQFTLIVSHIDSMRDAVDTLLEIKKEKSFSSINFD